MPELPEVEVARINLTRWAVGRTIAAARAPRTRVLRPASPQALRALDGRVVLSVERLGKALLWRLGDAERPLGLYAHLGMTGKWLRRRPDDPPSHSRARLTLDDGWVVHLSDPRMFGRLLLVPGARFAELAEVARLGPDPLRDGVDPARLGQRLARSRRAIKVALLDQSLLAGVGNIQASEALFRARIDPRRPASEVSAAALRRLGAAVTASIEHTLAAFRRGGVLDDRQEVRYLEEGGENPFLVYDRAGQRCPRCRRATIERLVLSGRATFLCPREQR